MQNQMNEVKLEDEDQDVKAPLTKFGREQILTKIAYQTNRIIIFFVYTQCDPSKFEDLRIETVLVSPLKRAVETAVLLFQNHPNKPKFVIEPYLCEIFLQDVILGLDYKKLYDRLSSDPKIKENPNMWSLEFIYDKNIAYLKQYIKETEHGSQAFIEKVFEYMKQQPIQVETF